MSINVNKNTCIGCSACAAVCPQGFKMTEDGKAEPVAQEDPGCAQQAADTCPVRAISIDG